MNISKGLLGFNGRLDFQGIYWIYPHPVTVNTRITTFFVGNPYTSSFANMLGRDCAIYFSSTVRVSIVSGSWFLGSIHTYVFASLGG